MKKLLLSGAILIASITGVHAQWIQQTSNITPGYYVPFIDAVDDQVVWGIVADPLAQTNPVAEFTKTVDGGNLWISGSITNAANLAPSCIFGLNADTAWVAMWNVSGGAGKILKTTDGGATWTHQSTALFNAAGNFPDWVYFFDASNGVCLGDPVGGNFEIYTTSNGGANWIPVPSVNIPLPSGGEFGITDVFTHQGDSTIFFGTNFGRIYKSTDRGLTWIATQTPFNDFIGAIAFRDANNGLAVSGGATGSTDVAYTTDGGLTWNLKGSNTVMNLILGMCYVPGTDSTYFISTPAAGSIDGTLYSPNDGTNWIAVDNLIHTDIEFVNNSTGWTGSNEANAPMMKWQSPIVPPTTDAASQKILGCVNAGNFAQHPKAIFFNNGLSTQTFDVTMTITGGYTSTKTIANLPFLGSETVTFDTWTPLATGPYTIEVYTSLTGDSDNNNDTLQKNITVFDGFENYGWTIKPNVTSATFGLAGAFNLNGNTTFSPGTYYSIGGADFTAVQPTTNAFATDLNSWSTVTPMPSAKYQFSAQKAGNNIYCAGGYTGGFAPDPITYFYSLSGATWNVGPSMPVPTGDYASGVYMDTLIYYIGGYDGFGDQNIVQIFNTVTNTWSTGTDKPGTAVAGLRGSINGNTIVVAGGYSQLLGGEVADAYIGIIDAADPTIIAWSALPAYPGGTAGRLAAGTVYRDLKPLILFVGGDPDGQGINTICDCWAYDLNQSQWLAAEGKPTAVSNISDFVGLVYNDSLWMASTAGYDGTILQTAHEWLNLGPSPAAGFCGSSLTVVGPCSGACNGSLTVNTINGVPPFSYLWSTGDTTASIDSLCAGSYSVTVTDSIGCISTSQVTLSSPVAVITSSNILCNGDCNGTASVDFQDGQSPFTYLWSGGETTDSISGLCPGSYSVTVQDASGCTESTSVTITEPDTISSSFTGIDVLCSGLCHGSFIENISGGTPPYLLTTCAGQILVPGALCAANYCVIITDANGCSATNANAFEVNQPPALLVSSSMQDPSCTGCSDGFIDINISGGTVPYVISWTPANGNLSNDSIINLPGGIYVVTVTDANGCATTFIDTLTEPTGIQNYNAVSNDLVTLYPNPAASTLTVKIKESADLNNAVLSISDISGRKVRTITVGEGQKIIYLKLSDMEAGVYFLNILKEDGNSGGYVRFVKD